ncbi:hypothetical protein OG897_36795 [Streptomyces sp. NBC_00237]|uniref:hypothetical protein n=1 Tax=Streptomyces sp. NBC_00237 TaxID=2975687 RepID=UPI0022517C08|nr:hypothetical protein [Streptomyces sp. NBC_00237]MCX5206947.1 hypothetical protein [Streptomyces sp. NBC_00237]
MDLKPLARTRNAVAGAVVLAAVVGLTGCASAKDADPETKTFAYKGKTVNVKSHGIPTDLVATDRDDILVTRWFDVGAGADEESSWELKEDVLDLVAKCSKLANCDVRYKVEVPKEMKVLRNGKATDLKGEKGDKEKGTKDKSAPPAGAVSAAVRNLA